MKYILRLIVAIPAVCIAFSMVYALAFAIEYPVLVILAIGNFLGLVAYLSHFEILVSEMKDFVRVLSGRTPVYD